MRKLKLIWNELRDDEAGMTPIQSMILLMTIVSLGAIAGVMTYRDQLIQEYGDLAVTLESLDQSYSVSVPGPMGNIVSEFGDSNPISDPKGQPPADISVTAPATHE
jgi:hypothetical protein